MKSTPMTCSTIRIKIMFSAANSGERTKKKAAITKSWVRKLRTLTSSRPIAHSQDSLVLDFSLVSAPNALSKNFTR